MATRSSRPWYKPPHTGMPIVIPMPGKRPRNFGKGPLSGLVGQFTHILSADLVKVYKPDPRVYELAPIAFGLPREAIVFVSSNSFDVMGAKAYGFQVAWMNRTQAQADELGLAADIMLSRLDELPHAFPAE
jgi:FMN phosphatase YigB (HAD superfamily)